MQLTNKIMFFSLVFALNASAADESYKVLYGVTLIENKKMYAAEIVCQYEKYCRIQNDEMEFELMLSDHDKQHENKKLFLRIECKKASCVFMNGKEKYYIDVSGQIVEIDIVTGIPQKGLEYRSREEIGKIYLKFDKSE